MKVVAGRLFAVACGICLLRAMAEKKSSKTLYQNHYTASNEIRGHGIVCG